MEIILEGLGKQKWGKDGTIKEQNAIGNEEVKKSAGLGNSRW